MRNLLRKETLTLPVVIAATLFSVGGVAAAAPEGQRTEPAQTIDCSKSHSNKDSGKGRAKTELHYRVGPHTKCAARGKVAKGTLIYYHCYTVGSWVGDNTGWTWGRIAGTRIEGWFADHYLSDGGARKHC